MFSHQGGTLFGRIKRIRSCDLVGESASLRVGFKVSCVAQSLRASQPEDQATVLSYGSSGMYVTMLFVKMIKD